MYYCQRQVAITSIPPLSLLSPLSLFPTLLLLSPSYCCFLLIVLLLTSHNGCSRSWIQVRCEYSNVWQCNVMVINKYKVHKNQYLLVKFEFKLMKCLPIFEAERLVKTSLGQFSIFQNYNGLQSVFIGYSLVWLQFCNQTFKNYIQ